MGKPDDLWEVVTFLVSFVANQHVADCNCTIDFFPSEKKNRVMLVDVSMLFFLKNHQASASVPGLQVPKCLGHTPDHMKLRKGLEMIGDDFHHTSTKTFFFIDCAVSGTHHLRSAAYD